MQRDAAITELEQCCGSARWATDVARQRPYASVNDLQNNAERVWWSLKSEDWIEAFGQHPRIGERAEGWAKGEQSGMEKADDKIRKKLATLNKKYEKKFGHVFLICATGRGPESMLRSLEQRLKNDEDAELKIAAQEQAKITRLRIDKLLAAGSQGSGKP